MGKIEDEGSGISLDPTLTAGGICEVDEHPQEDGSQLPIAPQKNPQRVGQDVYDPDACGDPLTICSR